MRITLEHIAVILHLSKRATPHGGRCQEFASTSRPWSTLSLMQIWSVSLGTGDWPASMARRRLMVYIIGKQRFMAFYLKTTKTENMANRADAQISQS